MELRAETQNQGAAFLKAVAQGWPDLDTAPRNPGTQPGSSGELNAFIGPITLPVAAGACCAAASIPLSPALTAYLHAFVANVVSAALRSMPIGQSMGLSIQGALEPAVEAAADHALAASPGDIGSASPMLDWLSATHETQYSRLFRS
jgi:urease accessory protein